MKKCLSSFLKAILAGCCIAIGGLVYLSVENKVIGSFLFSVGLYAVCTCGFNLYTGKVCYIFDNKFKYFLETILIWFGNLVGTVMCALLFRMTRLTGAIEAAEKVIDIKFSDNFSSIFILAIFCNVMIYVGVDSYKNNPHEFGKYLGIVLGIMVFILCGFEHCVANMFYITMAGSWSEYAIEFLVINTIGNIVGGVAAPLLKKWIGKLDK